MSVFICKISRREILDCFSSGSDRTRATVKMSLYSLLRAAIRRGLLCDFDTCPACSGACVRLRIGELGNYSLFFVAFLACL